MNPVLDHCLVLQEAKHGQVRFYKAQDPDSSEVLTLVAVPRRFRIPQPDPALLKLSPLRIDTDTQWFRVESPTGLSLNHLWASGKMDEGQLVSCILELVNTLIPAVSAAPTLIPSLVTPDHVWRTPIGTWALDLADLALLPDIQLGAASNPVKAIGELLRLMTSNDTSETEEPAALSTEFQFIVMRAAWGGFGSLQDLRKELTELVSNRKVATISIPPSEVELVRFPQSSTKPQRATPLPPAGRSNRSLLWSTSAVVAALLLVVGVGVRSVKLPEVQASNETQTTSHPVVTEMAQPEPAPELPPTVYETGLAAFNDFLEPNREPRESPVPAEQPAQPQASPEHKPVAPAPPPTRPAESPKTEPEDPVAALDRNTTGDNLVVIRMWGKPIGQAYMFTNPGAPVLSLDAFTALMKRPIEGTVVGPQQLQLTDDRTTFITKDFLILETRVWLVLRPELAGQLKLQVANYGNGYLDLVPQL